MNLEFLKQLIIAENNRITRPSRPFAFANLFLNKE